MEVKENQGVLIEVLDAVGIRQPTRHDADLLGQARREFDYLVKVGDWCALHSDDGGEASKLRLNGFIYILFDRGKQGRDIPVRFRGVVGGIESAPHCVESGPGTH